MFNLEEAIRVWRRQLAAGGALSPEALEELEGHLREEVEVQERAGLEARAAFDAAVRQLGQATVLEMEFAKSGASEGKRLAVQIACIGCAVFVLVVTAWTVLLLEMNPLNSVIGPSLVSVVSIYIGFLPALFRRLSGQRAFLYGMKGAGIFSTVWVIWLVFGANIFHFAIGLPLQMLSWSLFAAYAMTALTAMHFDAGGEPTAFAGLNDLTFAARQSVGAARERASGFHHDYVGTEHLLLGLLETKSPGVFHVLSRWGISEEVIAREIESIVGPESSESGARSKLIPLTPRAKSALQLAAREAKALNHANVRPEHIFLGLLREPDGVAGVILRKLGVNATTAREEISKGFQEGQGG